MNTSNEIIAVCPKRSKQLLDVLIANQPSDTKSVGLVYYDVPTEVISSIGSDIRNSYSTIHIQLSDQRIFGNFFRYVLIVDCLRPLNESIISFLSHVSDYKCLHKNLIVFLCNTEKVPSIREAQRNIKVILEKKEIVPQIITNKDNNILELINLMDINVQDAKNEGNEKARTFVLGELQDDLRRAYSDKENMLLKKKSYSRKKESMTVYSNQLLLDMWLLVQKSCDEKLDNDVRSFASEMLRELNSTIKTTDVAEMQYYFPSYINYLWGQFLSHEIEVLLSSVKEELEYEIEKLLDTYKDFFEEHASLKELNPISIYSGSQPVSFDVEHYDYTLNNMFDLVVGNIIRFVLISHGDWITGGTLSECLVGLINKIIQPLLKRKYSDEKIKQMYSEAIYTQFYENVNDMVVQLRDYLVPALERNFTESIQDIINQLDINVKEIGIEIEGKISALESYIDEVQNKIDSLNNINY